MFTKSLTSLRKLRMYIAGDQNDSPIDSTDLNTTRLLSEFMASVSGQIEEYLNRKIFKDTYTEYFRTRPNKLEYFIKGAPVSSITTVKEDSTGLFTGSESTLTDSFIGAEENSIVIDRGVNYNSKRGLQVVYVGGLALDAVESVYNITEETGTPVAGKYVKGSSSEAVGYTTAYASDVLTLDNYYGIFKVGETLTFYDDADLTTASSITVTYDSYVCLGLAESNPNLVTACNAQVRYMFRNVLSFEDATADSSNVVFKRNIEKQNYYELRPEVTDLLRSYRFQAM